MKYSINNHVRMILLYADYLGFDNYQQSESAILRHENWFEIWDCKDWKVDDLEAVTMWREKQIANNSINQLAGDILAQNFGL